MREQTETTSRHTPRHDMTYEICFFFFFGLFSTLFCSTSDLDGLRKGRRAFRMMNCGRGGFLARLLYEIREYVGRIGTMKGKGDYLPLSCLRRGFQRSIFFDFFTFKCNSNFFASTTPHTSSRARALSTFSFPLPFFLLSCLLLFLDTRNSQQCYNGVLSRHMRREGDKVV